MSQSQIKKDLYAVMNYPLCTNQSFNVSTWLPSTSFHVKTGDVFSWSLKSSATSGALTRNIRGSVGGIYTQDGPAHSQYNNGELFAIRTCLVDEIITIDSYTNTAATITSVVTIIRAI